MAPRNPEKVFIDKLRLYFSTIFARTMTKMVVGASPDADNIFYMSNISLHDIMFYEPTPDYYIHKVELKDTEFLAELMERMPVFYTYIFVLYTDKFLSGIAKIMPGYLNDTKLEVVDGMLILTVKTKDGDHHVQCGEMLDIFTVQKYVDVFEASRIQQPGGHIDQLQQHIVKGALYTKLPIKCYDNQGVCVFKNNGGCISVKEFIPKIKPDHYELKLLADKDQNAFRINIEFKSDIVDVISEQIGIIWFTKTDRG